MIAPSAANSFTSPAPVAPKTWPGSISASPSANPANEAPIVMPLRPNTANATPLAASSTVSGFGTRRVHRSIAAPVPAPAVTVVSTRTSEGLTNAPPEDVVNRVAQRADADHREDRDQRREQSVFEQVLAVVPLHETADRREYLCHEPRLSTTRDGRGRPSSITSRTGTLRRRRRERRRDAAEDRVDVGAGQADRHDGDERDQRDEQRVLEQVLSVFGVRELLETSDAVHSILLRVD